MTEQNETQTGEVIDASLPPETAKEFDREQKEREDEIIFKTIQSLRNRAKRLSPHGRARLSQMLHSYVG